MKPLHIALLALGATLAGGLAFEMTQPAPFASVSAAPSHPAALAPPAAPAPPKPLEKTKPSPLGDVRGVPDVTAPPAIFEDHVAAAPPAVYEAEAAPAAPQKRSQIPPAAPPQPRTMASAKPLQWTAVPYQQPSQPALPAVPPVPPAPPAPRQPNAPPSPPEVGASREPVAAALDPQPQPRSVTLNTGMTIVIRLSEPLSADRAATGDRFHATLAEPLIADGLVIAERGARVTGRIVESQKPGWLNTKSMLELELSSLATSDGQDVSISTDPWTEQGDRLVSIPSSRVIRFHLAGRVTVTERRL